MANTTNFGWETPDDTDLVKDGAAAIRTLGSAIDTSMVDLKGGTTGQLLSKNSNTDMDFAWTSSSGISSTIFDAKGDIIAASAADTAARLAVGTDGYVLTADSSTATGLKWASASTTESFALLGSTALTGATTITVNITAKNNLMIFVSDASSVNASSAFTIRFNSDTAANYNQVGLVKSVSSMSEVNNKTATSIEFAKMGNNAANACHGYLIIQGAAGTGVKPFTQGTAGPGATPGESYAVNGHYAGTSAITSVSIISSTGNFDNGNIYIYGV